VQARLGVVLVARKGAWGCNAGADEHYAGTFCLRGHSREGWSGQVGIS
jgi:hypothetical protein